MNIEHFGKGALKTPKEIRDRHFRLGAVPALIDWSQPYSVENGFTLFQRNQDGSSSCTAQAAMYYCEALEQVENKKSENYSARFNYSQSFIAGGGAYVWKAMSIPLKALASAQSVPDGDSSETTMEDGSLNSQAVTEARADKYAVIPRSNIDQMAQVVRDYHGFVTGFNGWNGMFSPDGTVTDWSKSDWGHAVYVMGYEIRNGKKYLKFKNSWSSGWGSGGYGYFPEDFVNSGLMFDCYTYADLADLDPNMLSDAQLNKLYLLAFKRPVDDGGRTTWSGKDFDTIADALLASPENQEYTKVFQAVKGLENDVRSGKF